MSIYLKILLLFFLGQALAQVDPNVFDKYEGSFISLNGNKIYHEVKGEGEAIFFLPGGPGNSHDYMQANFGQYYKAKKLVFFDWLGRGKSDDANAYQKYSVDDDVAVIEALRKHLKLDKIALVGHSYGTVPAQAYAIKFPDRVSKIVLMNGFHSGAMWQANCDSYNHYAKTHFPEKWQKVDSLRALGYLSSQEPLKSIYGNFPTKYIYYHNTALQQNVPKTKYRGWSHEVYTQIIGPDGDFDVSGSMINQDFRQQLKNIAAKTLIVAGRYDGVSTPEFAIQYKKFMPQAQFEMFENSGHNPYLEEPQKFYKLFEDFFEITN